ncbi:MiaB/RimO family radical SAM methylthiotransferase [Candidatus Deferrimicrobium sp.]|uniref:MiaB/RimO family radical SAM methylthiotransferase n=1 Tax=Candidatus Deferrimicrobium sp. TaxID=3060586 RepID=UPI002ED694A6
MRGRLSVVTVGCKANFADSATILTHAARAGFEVVEGGAPADVLVINSCTVTRRADRDCRALARRLRREHPGAVLVMTGCFAETSPDARSSVPEVDHWLGIREPSALPGLLRSLAGGATSPGEDLSDVAADRLLGHSRVFLKIQDGCDAACAYCVVPKARGAGRSLPRREIMERAVRAENDGAREIVLTGIHSGRYGVDRGDRDGLAELVEALLDATSRCRFRLGSVEPLEVTSALVSILSRQGRLCPHLHVPLQSGSDRVLPRMRRPYTARQYRERLVLLAVEVPGIRLGADVIAGFPGETRDDFEETMRLIRDTPLSYLHAFPYSSRPGTESAGWADDVIAAEKTRRVARLRAADAAMRREYLGRQVGKTLIVAVSAKDPKSGEMRGIAENYAEVVFRTAFRARGDLVPVRIDAVRGDHLEGTAV